MRRCLGRPVTCTCLSYGMHWCCNAVCAEEGDGSGLLLRALEPLTSLDAMRAARPRARRDRDLCSGPARLTQAMGIAGAQDGIDLISAGKGVAIVSDGVLPPPHPTGHARIGITRATDRLWRWYVEVSEHDSGP